jgi:hypothetical protein
VTIGALIVASAVLGFTSSPATIAPLDATVDRAWLIPATRREPKQLLVEWHRTELVAPKGGKPYPNVVWRLVLLTQRSDRGYSVVSGAEALNPIEEVRLADVTADRHLDVLVHDVVGNHWCGPTRVVATISGRPRTVFVADWCETSWEVRRGLLHVDEPRGGQSVCCPSHRLLSTYRWNGRRLALAKSRLVRAR